MSIQKTKGWWQEVIRKLLEYSFINLDAKTVELNVFDWNTASTSVPFCFFDMQIAQPRLNKV